MSAEAETVAAFVVPARRQRWVDGLTDPRRRRKLLARLSSGADFTKSLGRELTVSVRRDAQVDSVVALLRERGARDLCRVVAQDDDVDGRSLPLREALDAVVDDGGALLICVPGRLALLLPEAPSVPVLLESPEPA